MYLNLFNKNFSSFNNSNIIFSLQQNFLNGKMLDVVWFDCFLFSFSLRIENGNRNVFDWISIFIFNENIFPHKP